MHRALDLDSEFMTMKFSRTPLLRNLDPQTFTVKELKDNYFRSECKIGLLVFNWQLNAESNDNLSGNLAFVLISS